MSGVGFRASSIASASQSPDWTPASERIRSRAAREDPKGPDECFLRAVARTLSRALGANQASAQARPFTRERAPGLPPLALQFVAKQASGRRAARRLSGLSLSGRGCLRLLARTLRSARARWSPSLSRDDRRGCLYGAVRAAESGGLGAGGPDGSAVISTRVWSSVMRLGCGPAVRT
jgi:hypothetical protein